MPHFKLCYEETYKRLQLPPYLQAHSWVALGKLCLTDEALAKKCVPLFVQELGRAQQPAVRNNIMVALADLVINYTALVRVSGFAASGHGTATTHQAPVVCNNIVWTG